MAPTTNAYGPSFPVGPVTIEAAQVVPVGPVFPVGPVTRAPEAPDIPVAPVGPVVPTPDTTVVVLPQIESGIFFPFNHPTVGVSDNEKGVAMPVQS